MALEQTDWYFDYLEDPDLSRRLTRSQLDRIGSGSSDDTAWNKRYARLWLDDPPNPYKYGRQITGTPILNETQQRAEQVNSWQEFSAAEKRESAKIQIESQIPTVTLTDEVRDHTARAKIEQTAGRAKAAELALITTNDSDLDDFDPDLSAHEIQEPDYGENLAAQETRNLERHNALVSAGNGGLYEPTDVTEMQSRIQRNAKVARGEETGVQTPTVGAQRGDLALDGEEVRDAVFKEIMYKIHAGTVERYSPLFILDSIPGAVNPSFVFAMVYDGDNNYRGWMPFEEQADGSWRTPNEQWDAIAQPASSRWRCAIAHGGTQSQFEITRRVYLIPPSAASSRVRWGGRTG